MNKKNRSLRRALLASLVFLAGLGCIPAAGAQTQLVYAWKDAETGQTRLSTIPPAWYRYDAPVHGPRVIVSRSGRTIDDSSLPLAQRLSMAGWPEAAIQQRLEQVARSGGPSARQ